MSKQDHNGFFNPNLWRGKVKAHDMNRRVFDRVQIALAIVQNNARLKAGITGHAVGILDLASIGNIRLIAGSGFILP